ncbi:FAD/NAD(P)-binding domain-containing protein [Parathielavia appendiculata]|uniref:Cholesterol oxidase n=1 Tax=Parathielavia appendiculata TaxID=2587402 RepID=A0AAN6Z1N1_9PEZI|nr:FAD/NAD(P)-binding domain-containing protein [Parathielavia appendiculata]
MDGASEAESHTGSTLAPELDGAAGVGYAPSSRRSHGPYPRLSRPVELMRPSYDVVVIGSGYGGGVAASRMARGRQSVCVLERGKERWPGEFPETLPDAMRELRVSGEFAPGDRRSVPGKLVDTGNPTGLYHFAVGDGQNVYMANGLGGTSLVNANVFLEPHPDVHKMDVWPEELRGKEKWTRYYDRAKEVLEPTVYPESFPELLKTSMLKEQAKQMSCGDKFRLVPQTTRFEDGPNSTGVVMHASTLTGMDATGINDGSKSTTLVTYISDAWNWGAEIFCECEVRQVAKAPEGRKGYIVYFTWRSGKRDHFMPTFYDDLMWVHAKKLVFFGAGSLGTTEILLRSKRFGLDISNEVGTEMSGNGDMLGFGYNTDRPVNCIGNPRPNPNRPVGPCITAFIDQRDQDRTLDGFVVEDCAVPFALAPIMVPILEYLPNPKRRFYRPLQAVAKYASRLRGKVFGPYFVRGSVQNTAAYLIMSHDSSQGTLTLRENTPVLSYSGVGRSESVSRIHGFLETMTEKVGGMFVANPVWTLFGKHEITVHPMGGARISPGGTGKDGVTNHKGQVFKGDGAEVHEGLVVCDASNLPAALGVNPFATITALAERSVELAAEDQHISINYGTKNGILNLFDSPKYPVTTNEHEDQGIDRLANVIAKAKDSAKAGVEFTEVMSGFIHAGGEVEDFEDAAKKARSYGEAARFFLTVKSWDVSELVNSSLHPANLTGTFACSSLGGTFLVQRGTFRVFHHDSREPDTTNLTYDFDMVSTSGRKLHFYGYKTVNPAAFLAPVRIWQQTSTLYVTIRDRSDTAEDRRGEVVGRGMLHVQPADFLKGLTTFQASGPSSWARLRSVASYVGFFTKQLAVPFLAPLGRLQWPGARIAETYLATPPSQSMRVVAADGVESTMLMWDPAVPKSAGGQQPSAPAPIILFIPGAATDHTIFALPTIEKNAVDYFREAGYRVYCVTHRVGRTPVARKGYTPYDARRDIRAALEHIRKTQGGEKIYVVAHCAGSSALACGLLDGTIPGKWIRGITCSMVFMNPKFGFVNHLLSNLPVTLYSKLVSPWWDCTSDRNDTYLQRLINQLLRFYPVGDPRETCRSVVCHRSELVFGRLWTHKNLNSETHERLEHFLGGTSMNSLEWLMRAGRVECVTTNKGENLATPENIERLRGIPILFLSGTGNRVYTAENTDKSYSILCNAHGKHLYDRKVFPDKGHLDAWMSPTAYRDVYPTVRQHVEWVMKNL